LKRSGFSVKTCPFHLLPSRAAVANAACEISLSERTAAVYDKPRAVEGENLFADRIRQNTVAAVTARPDRYVYGGAENAEQLNMLIGHLLQNLRAGRQAFQEAALSVPPNLTTAPGKQ
jgi:hypothetical protein